MPCRHYVLCVGSLEPRKNLPRLLQAWSRIQSEVPGNVWLVLTGKKGNERIFADAAGLSRLPPRVHLTGHVPDDVLPALYAGAIAFAYPSVYEGFGLPPLEAMAAGIPVLTGNQTSLPEVVGDAGVMVDPYDVDALADGLLRLLGNRGCGQDYGTEDSSGPASSPGMPRPRRPGRSCQKRYERHPAFPHGSSQTKRRGLDHQGCAQRRCHSCGLPSSSAHNGG